MIPGTIGWNYYQLSDPERDIENAIACKLLQATEKIHYSVAYTPNLGNRFTLFIVHIGKDPSQKMDVISTIVKTPSTEFYDYEYINKGDYYCFYTVPITLSMVASNLWISDKNCEHKSFYFNNENVFCEGKYISWGFPQGIIDFEIREKNNSIQLPKIRNLN